MKEYKEYIPKLKFEAQVKAWDIRIAKKELKKAYNRHSHSNQIAEIQAELQHLKVIYRRYHIAYCLLRGTPYGDIEQPREGNSPDFEQIRLIQAKYTGQEYEQLFAELEIE